MSRKYKIRDQERLYFVTFTVIEWIDLFSRQVYRDIFLDSLRFCQTKKVWTYVPIVSCQVMHI
jgi:putative transposase